MYEATGRTADAKRQYDLVEAIQKVSVSAGVDVDMELALFDLDHGFDRALALQKALASYQRRSSVYAADVLAWAYYQNGRYAKAQQYSTEALRLGSRDALLHYHAGLIELALNDRAAARQQLEQALTINPYFSIRYASQVRAVLDQLTTK
jgi:tetratricopeptide (TPR) repeat protein